MFVIMKTHVHHGEDIVRGYDWLMNALDVVTLETYFNTVLNSRR